MVGRRVTAVASTCVVLIAACSLGTAGLAPDQGADATSPPGDAGGAGPELDSRGDSDGASDDATTDAAPDAPEASADAPSGCGATLQGPESAAAFRSIKRKTLDGLFDDWGCQAPLEVSVATAEGRSAGDGGIAVSARVKIEWDSNALYFATN